MQNEISFGINNISDIPSQGDLVAIDAEFVELIPEETSVLPDGRRVVLHPGELSLARVSCVKGWSKGKPEADLSEFEVGKVFMDDYISTQEPVKDYLSRFSGIYPGDLDPYSSKHHVTSLKNVYLKLRYMVDRGCRFVGHGLQKDFRIMNILVPPEQVIDTVELFNFKRQRKISLRFLAAFLLNLDIQTETHDSIEDAKTALLLYHKYKQLQSQNTLKQTLHEIYRVGRTCNWELSTNRLNAQNQQTNKDNL